MKCFRQIVPLILFISLQSCVKDIDVNQIDDAFIETSYIATLVHLNIEAPDFLNVLNEEIGFTSDNLEFTPIKDSNEYLQSIQFTLISENTFSREFNFRFVFYNALNQPIYFFDPVIIPPNSSNLLTLLNIPNSDIGVVQQTAFVGFELVLSKSTDGSIITTGDPSILNLKSSMELFFKYKKV